MRPGTFIRLPDGREGTVVYHSLDGYGIQWGRVAVDVEAILTGNGNLFEGGAPQDWPWAPEAMLRNPYPSADLPCVGTDYRIIYEDDEGEAEGRASNGN
jgi:hypothetical protein